jgi:hypothetical protein
MEPKIEQMILPSGYGEPKKILKWADVRRDLEDAASYWVASTRPDGRPHVVPRDGLWLDDTWYYGGSPDTVHNRNLQHNRSLTMHIGDGMKAIIVEGDADFIHTTQAVAQRLSDENKRKYSHYGIEMPPETYMERGVWALKARRVLAWNTLFEDATRFTFS